MKVEPTRSAAGDLAAADSAYAVVSPPPFDALWHADFEAAPCSETALGRTDCGQVVTDADALLRSECRDHQAFLASQPRGDTSDFSDFTPPTPTIKREPTPQDAKQARQVALAARRRRVYRVKKKSELEALRETSAVLGDRLAELIARNEALKDQLVEQGGAGRFAAGWRGVALRQLRRRIEAEALNRELRGLVCQHNDVAQALACTLRSQLSAVEPKQPSAIGLAQRQTPKEVMQLQDCDIRTVAVFLQEIDATYAEAEAVLRDCHLPAETEHAYNSRQGWRRYLDSGSEYFELIETWVVPFGLQDAVPAMHKSIPIVLAKECRPAIIQVPDPSSTTAIKFLFSCTDGHQRTVWYQSILVAKVFLEKDRAVFRWQSVTVERECVGSIGDEIVETGWGVARRAPSASGDHHDPAGTRVEFYSRFGMRGGPVTSPNGARRNKRLEEYVNMMFSSAEEGITEWYQVIENLVMNDLAALDIGQAP